MSSAFNSRHLAAIALLLAAPVILLSTLLFLLGIGALQQVMAELQIEGSEAFLADRNARLLRLAAGFLLYGTGIFAIIGLGGICLRWLKRPQAKRIVWMLSAFTSIGMIVFYWGVIDMESSVEAIVWMILLPAVIAVISIYAMLSPRVSKLDENTQVEECR